MINPRVETGSYRELLEVIVTVSNNVVKGLRMVVFDLERETLSPWEGLPTRIMEGKKNACYLVQSFLRRIVKK